LCHFLPNDLYFLRYIIQQIIAPVAEVNLEDDSWTTTHQATTAGSSLGSKDNVCENTLSSQSTYKINSGCPYYKASIAFNPKLLNDFDPSKENLETVYGGIMEEVNELWFKLLVKKLFLPLIIKATLNTNIA
jgi:hypothetical protein